MNESDAAKCRRNGWVPGTRLVGDEGYGPTVIRITAIGYHEILAIQESHNGKPPEHDYEGIWSLAYRDWRLAEPRPAQEER